MDSTRLRIGIIGTGFVARNFLLELRRRPRYRIGSVLTRRHTEASKDLPYSDHLTNSLDDLIASSDVIFECSGDAVYASSTIGPCLEAGRPVVTLDSEFHVTVGSFFVGRGLLTEAAGDQPGCMAMLHEQALDFGFRPLALLNMKAFLNRNPTIEEMAYWADRLNYSLPLTVASTDGSKIQVEQCLAANGLGANIIREEMVGLNTCNLQEAADVFAEYSGKLGEPVCDYIIDRSLPHGVFVVGQLDEQQAIAMRNYKMGDGPNYVLEMRQCLVHLEVFGTIERLVYEKRPLLDNSALPSVSVATVAKRTLCPGDKIGRGYGSFDVRGVCVNIRDRSGHLPIGLAQNIHMKRSVEPGQVLTFDDVDIADNPAIGQWLSIEQAVLDSNAAPGVSCAIATRSNP